MIFQALTSEEESNIKEAFHPFVMKCAEEYSITEEQFEEAKEKHSAEGIDPCFMSCFMKESGFVSRNKIHKIKNKVIVV